VPGLQCQLKHSGPDTTACPVQYIISAQDIYLVVNTTSVITLSNVDILYNIFLSNDKHVSYIHRWHRSKRSAQQRPSLPGLSLSPAGQAIQTSLVPTWMMYVAQFKSEGCVETNEFGSVSRPDKPFR
jgi:hypothetical protein